MADVAANLYDWSTTASSNNPNDSTTIGAGLADNFQQVQATVRAALAHKGSDIASATTTDIGAVAGLFHDITGTTTITGLGTVAAGIWKVLQFDGALTLTHNASSLILPGAANITTAAGDVGIFFSLGSGNWICIGWLPASAAALTKRGPAAVCQNLAIRTHATNPNYQLTITADVADIRDTSGTVKTFATVSLTADISTSGANGLDTGVEASGTWYYVWIIGKADGTVASLLSISATSPTMPSGYTFKGLVGAVRNDGSSNFLAFRQGGNEVWFEAPQSVLSGGSSTTEASVSTAAAVPSVAAAVVVFLTATATADGSGNIDTSMATRLVTGTNSRVFTLSFYGLANNSGGNTILPGTDVTIPNISQNFYYIWTVSSGSSPALNASVTGFKLPMGGE